MQALARGGDEDAAERLANPPPLSPHALHVWNWFADITQTRPSNGFGTMRMPREEIQAWERDEGIALEPWERRAILGLDTEYLVAMAPKAKGKSKGDAPAQEEA